MKPRQKPTLGGVVLWKKGAKKDVRRNLNASDRSEGQGGKGKILKRNISHKKRKKNSKGSVFFQERLARPTTIRRAVRGKEMLWEENRKVDGTRDAEETGTVKTTDFLGSECHVTSAGNEKGATREELTGAGNKGARGSRRKRRVKMP